MNRKTALSAALVVAALIAPAAANASAPAGAAANADGAAALRAAETALATGGGAARDATAALRELAVALPTLRGPQRRQAVRILRRPTDKNDRDYFGKEAPASPICDQHFCIHWTEQEKRNAPVSQQFLADVQDALSSSYDVENGTLGWQAAKSDGSLGSRHGVGGDGQVDVYITDLGKRLYGYAAPDRGQKGPRRYAYLVLDNDYRGFPSSPIKSLRVTVAHEYNHILQFGYDSYEDIWLFEDTATWMEEQVYPEINDYLNYLPAFAKGSEAPMTGRSIKIYAEAVFNHWLAGRYGPQTIRDVWAASQAGVKPKHLATAAYTVGSTGNGGAPFATEFGEFAAATAEWRAGSAFPDAAAYPNVRRRGTLKGKPQRVVLNNTSFRLVNVKPVDGPVTLKVRVSGRTASTIALIGRTGPAVGGTVTTAIEQLPRGGSGTVTLDDAAQYARVTAAVINADGRSKGFRHGERRYTGDNTSYRYSLG